MEMKPINREAYHLLHQGIEAFIEIERTGIRIDIEYCNKQSEYLDRKIDLLIKQLDKYEEIKLWKKVYGKKFNFESNPQLADVLFNHLKLSGGRKTEKGNHSVDQATLEGLDLPVVEKIIGIRRLKKARNTYLAQIQREQYNGILHPGFHLHIARTYRSSSSDPNFQNIPIRFEDISKIVRRAFIPRPGHQIGGVDYSGIEVHASAWYHRDPNFIEYITNPKSDMHRDTAADVFKLRKGEITKDLRYCAKNMFVFPQFYGDWYKSCAKSLWGAIDRLQLKTNRGVPIRDHLKSQGTGSYVKFENHIRDVEHYFWNKRFPIYSEWKKEWVAKYERDGYLDMLTGFRVSGALAKNQIVNYPIQGVAFHCLLWSVPRLVQLYKDKGYKSMIIGQIHDEITMDNYAEEMNDILPATHNIMCRQIKEHWPWIVTPLAIEAEFADPDQSWYYKKPVAIEWEEEF